MNRFSFVIDDKSQAFVEQVVQHLIQDYGVDIDKACGWIEQSWAKVPFDGIYDLRYHELPADWAEKFYTHYCKA